jgi:hypothetical protein
MDSAFMRSLSSGRVLRGPVGDARNDDEEIRLVCLTGKSETACPFALSSLADKNISVFPKPNQM